MHHTAFGDPEGKGRKEKGKKRGREKKG